MPSLGQAYIDVHANTAPFKSELEAQVRAATAAVEKSQRTPAAARRLNPSTSDETKALAAQNARNRLLYQADQRERTAASRKAEQDILRSLQVRERAESTAYAENIARDRAAAEARRAIRARDRAENDTVVRSHLEGLRAIQAAERAAYTEHAARTRAAAAAERDLARAARDAADNHRTLRDRLVNLSSTLSRIGFTGQTRLITLGLTFGFPLVALAAFTLASAAAATAVAFFGVKAADAARSATLQFKALGLSADEAKKQFASLQALSNKGLQIANLDADASRLLQLGVNAKDTTKILSQFADIFSTNGDVGATLQKNIDDTTKKFATLVNTAKITPRTFQTAVASLGIGVTAQQAFDQVKKNLDVTTAKLDIIIQKGKLSGSALAQAALQAATPGTAGGLSNAVASSPTQALEAAKSSAQTTLANAFAASGTTIAGFIGQLSVQVNQFITKFSPKVIKMFTEVLPGLISAIKPFGDALIANLGLVESILKGIGPTVSHLSADITNFFHAAKTDGSETNQILGGLNAVFHEILDVVHAVTPAAEALAKGLATVVIALGALEPGLKAVAAGIHFLTNLPFVKFLITGAVVLAAFGSAVGLASKIIERLAVTAGGAAAVITMMGNAEGRAAVAAGLLTAANEALAVSNEAVAATAGAAAGAEGAAGVAGLGGAAARGAGKVSLFGRAVTLAKGGIGSLSLALGIAAPELLAAVAIIAAAGYGMYKFDQLMQYNAPTLGKAGAAALDLQAHFAQLDQAAQNLGLSADFLDGKLSDTGLQAINTAAQAGTLGDTASAIIGQLEAAGKSADQTSIALQSMGVNAIDAANAVKGIDTSVASAQLHALADQALVAAGAMAQAAAVAQELWSAQHGGVAGPITHQQGVDALANARSGAVNITPPKLPKFSIPSAAGTGASAAANKIKTAFSQLNDDLAAIADHTSKQTASQIKSEFKALIKDLDDSGNKSLDAGAKAVENRLLKKIKTLALVQKNLAGELTIAQAVKDSATSSGSIDKGTGIATTFAGVQNKLRFGVATTQQFLVAIKKLQAEHLNATSIKQLVDGFASDPAGALAAARALISAGQIGITGAGGINALQGQLTTLGNSLGNSVADELYQAGRHAADGLLDGLKSKEKELEAAINKIGDDLSKNMKKKIKAHSPSEVFGDIGGDVVDGLVGGVNRGAQKVAGAASGMAQTLITFGPGSVAVNNADPKNPAGSGLMVGHGIVGILERQKTAAVLMGVG